MFFLAELYWQFCNDVNGEDVSHLKTFEGLDESFTVTEAEARIYAYLYAGYKIKCAYLGNVMIGFLIYQRIFETIVIVKCLFFEPLAVGRSLGKGMINSLQPLPEQVIFQSRKAKTPDAMLKATSSFRTKIAEDQFFDTWIMPWRADGTRRATEADAGS